MTVGFQKPNNAMAIGMKLDYSWMLKRCTSTELYTVLNELCVVYRYQAHIRNVPSQEAVHKAKPSSVTPKLLTLDVCTFEAGLKLM